MAAVSKEMFNRNIQHLSCHQVIHTWHTNCLDAWYMFVKDGSTGIFKFFFIMYLAQHIIMRKKITRKNFMRVLKDYLTSVLYGHAFSVFFIVYTCTQHKLLGKLNYYLTMYGTGCFLALTSNISPKSRCDIETTYFFIMALESWLGHLSHERILPRDKYAGAPYFMLCNAVMMLLLWNKENTNKSLNISWFFKPYSKRELCGNKFCCHQGTCLDDCIKVSTKYFLIGLGISAIKLVMKKFKKPEVELLQLLNTSYLMDPVFLWSYVVLQKVIHCFLTLSRGEDCQEHAFIAGLVSGITYLIQPNISIPASSSILIIKALFDAAKKKYRLPKLPYQSLMYMASTAILMHFCMSNRKLVPAFFKTMIYRGTNGRSEQVFSNIEYLALGGTPKVSIWNK